MGTRGSVGRDGPGGLGRGEPSKSYGGSSASANPLATGLSHIARQLQSADGAAPLLDEVVAEAIHLIPGCTEGSIAAVVGRKVQHKAASSELARQVDAAMPPCTRSRIWGSRSSVGRRSVRRSGF